MKIKLQQTVATLGGRYLKGETHEVAADLGGQWIKNGWAKEVKPPRAKKPRSKVV